jgi:lipid A 4'-phosphatase
MKTRVSALEISREGLGTPTRKRKSAGAQCELGQNQIMRFYFSVVLASLVIFIIDPGLDLTVSALFYRPEVGFIYRDLAWVRWSYSLFAWLQFPILGLLAVGFIAGFFNPQWLVRRKALWFLLLSLLLGPGLAVNEGLKNHWGRARPVHITEFGGAALYSPPWKVSDQCQNNCSMSSGHAALGFFPMALAWVIRRQRRFWLTAGLISGGVVGLGRILQGGHFLSDVLVSAAVVWLVCAALARFMFKPASKDPEDAVWG